MTKQEVIALSTLALAKMVDDNHIIVENKDDALYYFAIAVANMVENQQQKMHYE